MDIVNPKLVNKYILGIKNNKNKYLKILFNYTITNMTIIAEFYCLNKSNVDDVISEVYFNICKHIDTFNHNKNGYAWMVQINKNLCFKYNKDISLYNFNEDKGFDENLDKEMELLFLKEQICKLTDSEKEYIKQIYIDGYTIKEIALKENIPITTLYSRLQKIYSKLKENMKE